MTKNPQARAAIALYLLALVFASCYRARTECVPQLPSPSGKFAVGRLGGQHLTDSARPDRFSSDATKHRELMIYVWYPAQLSNHPSFEAYVPRAKQIEASVCGRRGMRELSGVSAFADYPDHVALTQPFLLMEIYRAPSDAELARLRLTQEQWQAYIQKKRHQLQSCKGGSYDVVFSGRGMVHASFSDEPLLGAPCGSERSSVAFNNLLLIEKTIRAFLDKYLRKETAPLLDQPRSIPPNMTVARFLH